MLQPEKEPEEIIFELYSPPAAAPAEVSPQIEYTPQEMDLPTLDDIPDPEIPELPPKYSLSNPPNSPQVLTK